MHAVQNEKKSEEVERFNRTLFAALDALEARKIPYALIGGVASSGLGRPRATDDIDLFVRAEEAGAALDALAVKNFKVERTDPNWLFKGFREGILVDVIFRSRGDIYFDNEMNARTLLVEYHGRKVRTVSPEDLIVIKCAVHDEVGPHHWHDALALLSHATLDWDYLIKRARRAQRRLLALLIYAQSNDIGIPNQAIFNSFRAIYGDEQRVMPSLLNRIEPRRPLLNQYLVAHLREALVRDARTGQQDIKVTVEDDRILLKGQVLSEELRHAAESVVRDTAPSYRIENRIGISALSYPGATEDITKEIK